MSGTEHSFDKITKWTSNFVWGLFLLIMIVMLLFSCALFVLTAIEVSNCVLSWLHGKNDVSIIQRTLHVMELLLIAPLPFMIGVLLYNWSLGLRRSNRILQEGEKDQHSSTTGMASFVLAKSLVIGLLVSVVGVNLVEKLLASSETPLNYYIGGVITIMALVIFYVFLQKDSSVQS